eukprot:scaffold1199_cov265-Pinguiococcus_pyrenoidosus.AAC.7
MPSTRHLQGSGGSLWYSRSTKCLGDASRSSPSSHPSHTAGSRDFRDPHRGRWGSPDRPQSCASKAFSS